jgi:hypothetical protein
MTWRWDGVTLAELQRLTQIMQIEKGALTSEAELHPKSSGQTQRAEKYRPLQQARAGGISAQRHRRHWQAMFKRGACGDTYAQVMQRNFFLATLADGGTFQDAIDTIDKYDAWDSLPASITSYLRSAPPEDETVKQAEYEAMNARVFGLTPKMTTVYPAVKRKAEGDGYKALMLCGMHHGRSPGTGKVLAACLEKSESMASRWRSRARCLFRRLLVTVGKETGIGGRIQEYAWPRPTPSPARSDRDRAGDTDAPIGPGGFEALSAPCLSGAISGRHYSAGGGAEKRVRPLEARQDHATSKPLWDLGLRHRRDAKHQRPGSAGDRDPGA